LINERLIRIRIRIRIPYKVQRIRIGAFVTFDDLSFRHQGSRCCATAPYLENSSRAVTRGWSWRLAVDS
jgi:hypothetical protein